MESIFLKNFRVIKEAQIELNGKNTVLFGVNGVGKSTILSAANVLFSGLLREIDPDRPWGNIALKKNDIAYGHTNCVISANFLLENERLFPFDQCSENLSPSKTHELTRTFKSMYLTDEKTNMPIFCSYSADRQIHDITIPSEFQGHGKLSALENSIRTRMEFNSLFSWILYRKKEEIKLQRLEKNYQDTQLYFIKKSILSMMDDIQSITFDTESPYMMLQKDGIKLTFDQLSDGEKCVLTLLADIARRLILANPTLQNPLEGKGIILIDEIELHMHTTWQRKILSVLHTIFPHIQFIITTHSPQVLGELGDNYHIYAIAGDVKHVTFTEIDSLKGWDSNYILEEFMGTSHMNEETKKLIENMHDCIAKQQFTDAENYADQLEKLTDSANSEVVKARILINRGRRYQ